MATSADRLTEFESAQKRYQDLIGGQGAFKSLVEQKLGEKTNYNKDLITQQQNLQERNLSLPTQLQQEWSGGVIRDPFAQRALIESRQSNIGSQLGAANALLAARGQEQSKILDVANNNYASQLAGEGTNAQMKYQLYQDALQEEASRRSAAAAANSNAIMEEYYRSLIDGNNAVEPEVSIETDEDNRSMGTKTLDVGGNMASGLGSTLANTPVVGNLYKSALQKFQNSNLGKSLVQGFLNLAKTPIGGKYISQTNIPELQALKKIQTKTKK